MKTIFQGPGNLSVSLGGKRKGVLYDHQIKRVEGATPHVGGLGGIPSAGPPAGPRGFQGG